MGCIKSRPLNSGNFVTARRVNGVLYNEDISLVGLCSLNLSAPTNLVATSISSTEINLTFDIDSDRSETGFEIYRSTDNVTFSLIDTITVSSLVFTGSYSDTGLTPSTTYYYYVIAIGEIDSVASNTASAVTFFEFQFYSKATAAAVFALSITYGGADTPMWVMPNGTVVNSASISAVGSTYGFDSTSKLVRLLIEDKSAISAFVGTTTTKPDGAFDFSVFTGATFSNISIPSGTVTSVNISGIEYTNSFIFVANNNSIATLATNTSSTATVATFNISSNSISTWNRGNLIFSAAQFNIGSNLFTTFAINASDTFNYFIVQLNSLTSITNLNLLNMVGTSCRLQLANNTGLNINALPTSFTGSLKNFNIGSCIRTGTLDLSGYTWSGAEDISYASLGVTSVVQPVGTVSIAVYGMNGLASLTDTSINFSGLVFNNCNLNTSSLSGITTITAPASGSLRDVNFGNMTSLTNAGDWSGCTFSGTNISAIRVNGNALTSFLMGTQTIGYKYLIFESTSITDFTSVITKLLGNPIVASPSGSGYLDFSDCGLSSAQTDAILALMDTQFTTSSQAVTIYVDGTNAAPGAAGLASSASLTSKNYTIVKN